jgi:hypothetical protein
MSVRSCRALRDDARLPLPYSGSLGPRFATYHRYYGSLRRLSSFSASSGCPLSADTLWFPCSSVSRPVSGKRHRTTPGELVTRLPPSCLTGNLQQGVDRPPRFLTHPCVRMPRSLTPAGSMTSPSLNLIECGLPLSWTASASHDFTTFQGSITQPAYSLHACFTVRLAASRARVATGLLTGFDRVGLAPTG